MCFTMMIGADRRDIADFVGSTIGKWDDVVRFEEDSPGSCDESWS